MRSQDLLPNKEQSVKGKKIGEKEGRREGGRKKGRKGGIEL